VRRLCRVLRISPTSFYAARSGGLHALVADHLAETPNPSRW